jgi:hypothetical protein
MGVTHGSGHMSKKKDIHTHTIFAELSHLSMGECMHHRCATPTAELGSQNRNEVGWSEAPPG